VELSDLNHRAKENSETTAAREQVLRAREMQKQRFGRSNKINSDLSPRELDDLVPLKAEARTTLQQFGARYNLSPRSYHRMLKVARTVADLEGSEELTPQHVLEALQYRRGEN